MENKSCTAHSLVRQSVTLNTPCDVDQRIHFIPWRDTGFVCVRVHCRTPSILWFLIVLTEFSRRLYNTYYTPTVSALGFEIHKRTVTRAFEVYTRGSVFKTTREARNPASPSPSPYIIHNSCIVYNQEFMYFTTLLVVQ